MSPIVSSRPGSFFLCVAGVAGERALTAHPALIDAPALNSSTFLGDRLLLKLLGGSVRDEDDLAGICLDRSRVARVEDPGV
jgi:hypothetical protein